MNFLKVTEYYDYSIKIFILGKDSIGKTIFLKRIKLLDDYNSFKKLPHNYLPTIGIYFDIMRIKFNNKIFKIQIWDTAGQERFSPITKTYYREGHSILIFYDAFDKESFKKAKIYYEEAFQINDKAVYFLIRSKYDLSLNSEPNDFISDEEAQLFADKNNIIFAHISSIEKNENGINEVFEIILKEYNLRFTDI